MQHLRRGALTICGGLSLRVSEFGCLQDPEAGRPKQVRGTEGPIYGADCILIATIASLRSPVMSCHESCGDTPVVRIESSLYCADM